MEVNAVEKTFLIELQQSWSAGEWSRDPAELAAYGRDWTRMQTPDPLVLCFPSTRERVAELLKLCAKHGLPVVPSGGRTGLAGGAVAANREVVLSLDRLRDIGEPQLLTHTIRVGAGAVHQAVQEKLHAVGLFWPVDLAAKGSCQIGGNVATNAGGLRVIRYGHTRRWVQSLEVVLMNGEILELSGELEKNNTGYDLKELFIGSEGTLGVITAVTLRVCPRVERKAVLLFALENLAQVLALLTRVRQLGELPVEAFECWTAACMESVCRHRNFSMPFASTPEFYALVEFEVRGETGAAGLEKFLTALLAEGLVTDGTLAESESAAARLWAYREGITESLAAAGLVYKNDLALPLKNLGAFTEALFAEAPGWYGSQSEIYVFGHVGDGNWHVNVLNRDRTQPAAFWQRCEKVNDSLFALIQKLGGSIAAEHGIGLLKKKYLHYSRRPEEIEIFRALKRACDPQGLLNPGKIIDL